MPSKIYERYLFRRTKQEPGENFENFLLRLRNQSAKCQFKDVEEHLIDQIVEKCNSVELRQKILATDDTINITGIIAVAKSLETVNMQLQGYVLQKQNTLDTNHINFSKDAKNSVDILAVDTTTRQNISCDKEINSTELSDEPMIIIPTYDLKVEIDETGISASTCTGLGQSTKPTKAVDTTTRQNISCDKESNSTELSDEPMIIKPTYDLKVEFDETTISGLSDEPMIIKPTYDVKVEFDETSISASTCTGLEQSTKPTKTETPSAVHKHIPCDKKSNSTELSDKHTITKPMCDLKVEFDETSISGSSCAVPGQSIEPTKTETPSQLIRSIDNEYAGTPTTQPEEHAKQPMKEKPFKCNLCDYATTHSKYLQQHKARHEKQKLLCSTCGYTSICASNMKQHMRRHSDEKPFKCTLCDYTGIERSRFTVHMRTHTGEKPFSCSVCDYRSAYRQDLAMHMRRHNGVKPYKCSVCDYSCVTSGRLKVHMRSHTDERPVKCSLCDYACRDYGNLNVHRRTHTGEKPYKCSVCEFTCSQNRTLKGHIRRMH